MTQVSKRTQESLWTIGELCEFLKVNESLVRYWMRLKTLPHIKIGKQVRFDPVDIRAWLSTHKSATYGDVNNAELKRIE